MKTLKVKKLAALAVAGIAAAMPFAAAAAHMDTLKTDRNWYLDAQVVVGAQAKASDVVGAGYIAAAIAELAYKKAEVEAATGEAKVMIEAPGQIVVGGQGYHYDDAQLSYTTSEFASALELGASKIPTLKENEDITVKYRASSSDSWEEDDATYSQKIVIDAGGIDITSYVDESKGAMKMVVYDDKVHFKTEVKSLDIPVGSYSESGKTLDNFEIDVLGTKYKVTKLNVDANGDGSIEISTSSAETIVGPGETVNVGGYKVKVDKIFGEDKPRAVLQLLDSEGNPVLDDQGNPVKSSVEEGETADFGDYDVDVKAIEIVPGEDGYVKLSLKSDSTTISLSGGSGTKNDFPVDDWDLVVTVTGDASWGSATKITGVTFDVVYHDSKYDDAENGIDVGGKLEFPSGGYAVVFAGATSEPMHEFKLNGNEITTVDKDGDVVTAKISEDKTLGKNFASGGDSKILTFSGAINGKDVAVKIVDTDNNIDNGYDVYVDYDYSGDEDQFTADGQATGVSGTYADINLDITDQDDIAVRVAIESSDSLFTQDDKVYLLFKSNNGSMTADSPYTVVVDWDNIDTTPSDYDKVDVILNTMHDPASGDEVKIPVRLEDGKLAFKEVKLGNDGDDVTVGLQAGVTESIDADADSDSIADSAILVDGTEVYVESSDEVEVKVPENIRKVDVFIGVPAQVEEGTNYMELGEGDEIPGTGYKIAKIETGAPEIQGEYYEKVTDIEPSDMVILDNEGTMKTNLIVVGGWYANKIAEELVKAYPEIQTEVEQDGKYIGLKELEGKNVLLVAGMSAEDTVDAAKEFVDWLKQNVQ